MASPRSAPRAKSTIERGKCGFERSKKSPDDCSGVTMGLAEPSSQTRRRETPRELESAAVSAPKTRPGTGRDGRCRWISAEAADRHRSSHLGRGEAGGPSPWFPWPPPPGKLHKCPFRLKGCG